MRLKATRTVPGVSPRSCLSPTNSSGSFRSCTLSSASGKRAPHERERVERAEQPDVLVLPREQKLGPRGATLLVVCPLHLVEDEHLATVRGHLDGAAEDRRVLVDPLLTGEQSNPIGAHHGSEPAMRFLCEHPQRAGVDAAPLLGQERERVVGLARVRRTEVRDDRRGLATPLGEPNRDPALGPVHCGTPVGTRRASVASRARGALGRS